MGTLLGVHPIVPWLLVISRLVACWSRLSVDFLAVQVIVFDLVYAKQRKSPLLNLSFRLGFGLQNPFL